MSSDIVIDLLSSDDESLVGSEVLATGLAGVRSSAQDEFQFSPDKLNSTVNLDQDWGLSPAKRRCLSPSIEDDALPALPRRHVSSKKVVLGKPALKVREVLSTITSDEDDPIVFTSSTHQTVTISRPTRNTANVNVAESIGSDDSLPNDILQAYPPPKPLAKLSSRTAALLASLNDPTEKVKNTAGRSRTLKNAGEPNRVSSQSRAMSTNIDEEGQGDGISRNGASNKRKNVKATDEQRRAMEQDKEQAKEARARERERIRERNAQEKEEDKERKRLQREEKSKEKRIAAELAEVNKAKLDKKDSTPEMIVDLPASLSDSSVDVQVREFLKNLNVETASYQSPIPNVLKWRRKTKAKWNDELEHWEPLPQMVIRDENHVLCLLEAKVFAALATAPLDDVENLETHVARLKSAHESCTPIYMIEGLKALYSKSKNAQNRAYQAQVLGQDPTSTQQTRKRKRAEVLVVDEAAVEAALLKLQVLHGCLIHHTLVPNDSATWIIQFTQHISTIPYRHQRMNLSTTFCMESGQVKPGEDKDDTFIRMLQEVVRVTPPIAQGIFNEYPSVVALVKAFMKHGPLLLENLKKSANRNGAVTDRNIGPAISRRLYKVFMERDPESTDV